MHMLCSANDALVSISLWITAMYADTVTDYAAAFFLLADHLQDAVNVCLNQIKDIQLAIAIARVYEGDSGPVLKNLLENEVLAVAAKEGNRWLASWAFWMLKRRDMAVRALIVSQVLVCMRSHSCQKLTMSRLPSLHF